MKTKIWSICLLLVAMIFTNAAYFGPTATAQEKTSKISPAILEQLEAFSEKGFDFVETEAPEICKEIILLGRIQYTSLTGFGFFLMTLGWLSYLYCRKRQKGLPYSTDGWDYTEYYYVWCCVVSLIVIVIGILFASINIRITLVSWFAPRIYVIEYFSRLLGLMR